MFGDSILRPDPASFYEEAVGYAEQLATSFERRGAGNTVVSVPRTRKNPFTKYTTKTVRNSVNEDVLLPLVVRATITIDTVTEVDRVGDQISAAAKSNVEKMADGLRRTRYHNGHIIGFQNGGSYTDEVYNFFPQNPTLNNGKYKIVENFINRWARFNGYVKMIVVLQYPANGHVTRPETVVLKATFYNQDDTLHSDCNTIVFYNRL
ncbi:hypothetical protein O0L34_g3480 [Tuta absoluta]|nr:hypothetical protein O0L34_g3480 [Tuta absoluta]